MSDDLISRKDAIDAFKPYADYESNRTNADWVRRIELVLHDLPSAQPKKRTEERTETHACDLISRQAAIGAIVAQTIGYTADEIKAKCDENIFNENGYLGGLKDAIEAIEDMPSAQPEVLACGEGELIAQLGIVRCKDCEYGEQDEYGRWYCRSFGCQVGDEDGNGFCSDAERRTDET